MLVYRISKCDFIHDLSGMGASLYGGRWNNKGVPMLYTAGSTSLSMLEVLVHIKGTVLNNFCQAIIQIPNNSILDYNILDLPSNWNTHPAPITLKTIGDEFVAQNNAIALKMPSSIVPNEYNFLLNPMHKNYQQHVKIVDAYTVTFDPRLLDPNIR